MNIDVDANAKTNDNVNPNFNSNFNVSDNVNSNTNGNTNVNFNVKVNVNIKITFNFNVNINFNTNDDTNVKVNVNSSIDRNINVNFNLNVNINSNVSGNASVDVNVTVKVPGGGIYEAAPCEELLPRLVGSTLFSVYRGKFRCCCRCFHVISAPQYMPRYICRGHLWYESIYGQDVQPFTPIRDPLLVGDTSKYVKTEKAEKAYLVLVRVYDINKTATCFDRTKRK